MIIPAKRLMRLPGRTRQKKMSTKYRKLSFHVSNKNFAANACDLAIAG
jgi:hypothetical protein